MRSTASLRTVAGFLAAFLLNGVPAKAELDAGAAQEAHRKAQHFIDRETEFHLGVLPTEQSNPKTAGLAETAQRDLEAAVRMLQAVDGDIPAKAAQVLEGTEFRRLVEAMGRAIAGGRRICFSGCGATGRLSILLEAAWRQSWQDLRLRHAAIAARLPDLESRVVSIMTGGDYALIRSVESFEDHAAFGRRQVREAKLGRGDVLVAISEGGETSSVIGTVWQALDDGAEVFFVFNNPAEVLSRHIERSRKVIRDSRVTKLDLACGPMAVAGSTRMQATTSELLVVGAALETVWAKTLTSILPASDVGQLGFKIRQPREYADLLRQLLDDLSRPAAVRAMAAIVRYEEQIYRSKALVTYLADACLLDIFTDTTERSPTFMLPRFRKMDDRVSPAPWAFVKSPLLPTPQAWRQVLRREPRCLEWDAQTYRELNAPMPLKQNPPRLGAGEMLKFMIGNEDDPSRYTPAGSAAILVVLGDEVPRLIATADPLRASFEESSRKFAGRAVLAIGPAEPPGGAAPAIWHVPVQLSASPLRIWDRLAAKLALNTVSTATMARMGRLMSNWMAHVEPTNKKLIDRGTRLVAELAGVDYKTACYALHETLEEQLRSVKPGQEKPSPVAITIQRLKRK